MNDTAHLLKSAQRAAIAPFIAMDVKREASLLEQAGAGIVHMEVGEPSAPPPRRVREAAIAALGGQSVGYTDALGLASLRERIARHYREFYGVAVDPARVAATTGSSGGFVMAFLALFDPGARVAIQNPGYPAYRNIFAALGVEAVDLPVDSSNGFAVTAAAIEKAHESAPTRRSAADEPRQSDRRHAERRVAAGNRGNLRPARHCVHFGRDLSRPDL